MKDKLAVRLILACTIVLLLASLALAEKLICISKEELRGQETVNNCLVKGEKFAIIDDKGVVRILSKDEMNLMRRTNPEIFKLPAYGIMYMKEAPPIPKLPPLAVPKQAQ